MTNQPMQKPSGANNRMMIVGTILVALVGGAVILFALFNGRAAPAQSTSPNAAIIEGEGFNGVQPVDPPRQLQNFTLTNQDNQPVSLNSLQGKMVLMLFGYTNCPDVCPSTLLEYKKIKAALGDQADQVNFVFISVDGDRDTPERLKTYVQGFDTSFIGLTGDEATLRRLGTDYDLYFEKTASTDGSADSYLVSHNSNTYLIDKQGRLVALYLYATEATVIAGDIQARLT
jgi:protein SCO1/2